MAKKTLDTVPVYHPRTSCLYYSSANIAAPIAAPDLDCINKAKGNIPSSIVPPASAFRYGTPDGHWKGKEAWLDQEGKGKEERERGGILASSSNMQIPPLLSTNPVMVIADE